MPLSQLAIANGGINIFHGWIWIWYSLMRNGPVVTIRKVRFLKTFHCQLNNYVLQRFALGNNKIIREFVRRPCLRWVWLRAEIFSFLGDYLVFHVFSNETL